MDFIGDLGGVHELLFEATSSLAGYLTFHSFMLHALKKMYLGSTKDGDLFITKNCDNTEKFKTLKAKPP